MKTLSRAFLTMTSVFVLATSLFAMPSSDRVQDDIRVLSQSHRDYTVFGTVCEETARLRLEEQYSKDLYTIDTGIEYNYGGRTVGELDVVVFENDSSEAVLIVEVKCWEDLPAGHRKALSQLDRFQRSVKSGHIDSMVNTTTNHRYNVSQFDGQIQYMTASQDGGASAGFDMTLGHDLDEFKQMYSVLNNR